MYKEGINESLSSARSYSRAHARDSLIRHSSYSTQTQTQRHKRESFAFDEKLLPTCFSSRSSHRLMSKDQPIRLIGLALRHSSTCGKSA